MSKRQSSNLGYCNRVRIIAGRWRGRWIEFADAPGLRPTPNRVRETLFNWLQMDIAGAKVLDLFAGSGALGLEALSRGARHVTFVDNDNRNLLKIKYYAQKFSAIDFEIIQDDALLWLSRFFSGEGFQVVFVDPPFGLQLWDEVLQQLTRPGVLAEQAFIYLEMPVACTEKNWPSGFKPLRQLRAGDVQVYLLEKNVDFVR